MTPRPRLIALAIVAAVLLLAACQPSFASGVVIDKRYTAAHDYRYSTSTCTLIGKALVCIPIWHTGHAPDKWETKVEGNCRMESDGRKCDTAWWVVSAATYETAQIGDRMDRQP